MAIVVHYGESGDILIRDTKLLEAMVERPPPRMVDEYGVELVLQDRIVSPLEESKKPPPRPYIRRTRSSSSTHSVDSQNSDGTASPIERTQSLPTSTLASPISPSTARPAFLGMRASENPIIEAEEPTS